MRIDSEEYKALMAKWSREAWNEEMEAERETYLENEDYQGRSKPIEGRVKP